VIPRIWVFLLCGCALGQSPMPDADADEDGLSDFLERHKYLSDPAKKDTDADGIRDGDWVERREHAYTIRSIVQIMRPVDVASMNDDFQDARELDATPEYVEVEVIHYPLNTVNAAIVADPRWRESSRQMRAWLEPGPTANWDEDLRRTLAGLLEDALTLDDKAFVEKVAPWLLRHAGYEDGFTTFFTAFDGKRPFVPDELRAKVDEECRRLGRTPEEQWDRELLAKGMFQNKVRGSCTSTAIYLTGCLRALGIPTRIVLSIPVVDASDAHELAMVRRNLAHHQVRRTVLTGLEPLAGTWASHTFNEVWVGGRWRRLNGDRLGQPILDEKLYGLTTHVATFRDWADAKAASTIGRRQAKGTRDDAFGGPNPYSALFVADRFGAHCKAENPPVADEALRELTIDAVTWSDEDSIAEQTRKELGRDGALRLLAHVREWKGWDALKTFTRDVDQRFFLEAEGHPTLSVGAEEGGVTSSDGSTRWVVITLGPADRRDLETGVAYRLRPRNGKPPLRWIVADGLAVTRKGR
jgi:hypothetical protein